MILVTVTVAAIVVYCMHHYDGAYNVARMRDLHDAAYLFEMRDDDTMATIASLARSLARVDVYVYVYFQSYNVRMRVLRACAQFKSK